MTTSDNSAHVPQVGERCLGTVVKTTALGAFVSLPSGSVGMVRTAQISKLYGGLRIKSIDEVIKAGDHIQVEIGEIDERGKLTLIPIEVPGR